MVEIRRSNARGHANHSWLDSWHSFSFADYYDPQQMEFGPLRVLNEDRIAPGSGFGAHSHRDMEIISYVLDGELAHRDSMGNGSVIRPGDVQRMSASTGVQHSEYNPAQDRSTHFLQIWIEPDRFDLAPSYEEKRFDDAQKRGRLCLIASPDGQAGSVLVHQEARLYAGLFDGTEGVEISVSSIRRAYIHLARGSVYVNDIALNAGDALKAVEEMIIKISRGNCAEVLLFDLP